VAANDRSGGSTDRDQILRLVSRAGIRPVALTLAQLDDPLPPEIERLVVAGGDGSIGVAARAANAAGIPLAVIPTGTANDFARALGLPRDLEEACALASTPSARTRHHEIGLANDHPFINVATAGLSAVASKLAVPLKPRLGPFAYTVAAVRAGITADPATCRVRVDGTERFAGPAWQVVVALTGAFGGGSNIGGTHHDDGLLDVAAVPARSRLHLARHGYGMRRGSLTEQADVHHHRGHVVELDLPQGTEFNIDGDLRAPDPPRFTLLPGGVEVVLP
jgi:YegS/Rv2252/BmrU family lipid kinase